MVFMSDKSLKKVLFIGAKAFADTGGIEQVNKAWIYSLATQPNLSLKSFILADDLGDERYTHHSYFKGYQENKLKFLWAYFWAGLKADLLIISHVQLAILIPILKLLKPKLQTMVLCHGIEVWGKLNWLQLNALKKTNLILAVSHYTKNKLQQVHGLIEDQVLVFPNALDPLFAIPNSFLKSKELMDRYDIKAESPVLLTIARLSFAEQYKGYDMVIKALKLLLQDFPTIKYIIGGKADEGEQARLTNLIKANGLTANVWLAGYIATDELEQHYQLADAFVMPSTGEGFGISFIEAAACGTPVLGGNKDGSLDAIKIGITGEVCNPTDALEIAATIKKMLYSYKNPLLIQENALKNYSFTLYHKRIVNLLAKTFHIL